MALMAVVKIKQHCTTWPRRASLFCLKASVCVGGSSLCHLIYHRSVCWIKDPVSRMASHPWIKADDRRGDSHVNQCLLSSHCVRMAQTLAAIKTRLLVQKSVRCRLSRYPFCEGIFTSVIILCNHGQREGDLICLRHQEGCFGCFLAGMRV